MKVDKYRILVIDDDVQLLRDIESYLEPLGYEVDLAEDGHTGLKLAQLAPPDLVVLDITFPDTKTARNRTIDGIEVLKRLRDSCNVPILMLSSSNIPAVKVMALSIGADDYVAKPFDMQELSARIEAILRRARDEPQEEKVLRFRRLQLVPGERRVFKDGEPIELTKIEFDILYTLARRPQHVFTRDKVIEIAWHGESYCVPKVVDVHVGHIRNKIEDDPANPLLVVTVRGIGYRFEDLPA